MENIDSWALGYEAGRSDKLNGFLYKLEEKILNDETIGNDDKLHIFFLIHEVLK